MLETEHNTGDLYELHTGHHDAGRSVEYRFVNGVSGEMTVLEGEPLLEGETYLVTHANKPNKRIEILKVSERYVPDGESITDYSFRVV